MSYECVTPFNVLRVPGFWCTRPSRVWLPPAIRGVIVLRDECQRSEGERRLCRQKLKKNRSNWEWLHVRSTILPRQFFCPLELGAALHYFFTRDHSHHCHPCSPTSTNTHTQLSTLYRRDIHHTSSPCRTKTPSRRPTALECSKQTTPSKTNPK